MRHLMLITLAVFTLSLGTACSKKSTKVGKDKDKPTAPSGPDGGGNQNPGGYWNSGGSAELTQMGSERFAFEDMADLFQLDSSSVSDVFVNISVNKVSGTSADLYAGELKIGWTNNYGSSSYYQEVYSRTLSNIPSAQFNHWVTHGPENYIKMFFESDKGAIIVVARITDDLGKISGKVFFKPFDYDRCNPANTWPFECSQTPPIYDSLQMHCWRLYYYSNDYGYSLYDCRDFLVGSGANVYIDTSSSVDPNGARTVLIGTFENLTMTDAGVDFP